MHDMSMAQTILRTVLSEAQRRGASEVHRIIVEIGELVGVSPAGLAAAFALEARDTPLENAELEVILQPAWAQCPACGESKGSERFKADLQEGHILACPDCGSPLEVEGLRGMIVRTAAMVLPGP